MIPAAICAYSTEDELRFIRRHISRLAFPHTLTAEQRSAMCSFLANCKARHYDRSINQELVHDLIHATEVSHGLD